MNRILASETIHHIEKLVTLSGWVHSRRDHGQVIFIDLRDRSGIVQTVILPKELKGIDQLLQKLSAETVIELVGTVKKRPEKLINPKLASGSVEIAVKEIQILGQCCELPFPLDTDGHEINEELRLKYRYLDLRRVRLTENIRLRSAFVRHVRNYLDGLGFTEIETPILTKSTPEGSRDFVVPSRLHPGQFYALPQSPQQYKQLLMVAGFERYYQIARCLRDEDLRADRGFEHTQIDIEMSFENRENVMRILEGMITAVFELMGQQIKQKPFPVFTYKEAIEKFGADKFDLRSEEEKDAGLKAFAWVVDFPFFEKNKEGNWTFTHNPFSSPKPEHIDNLLKKKSIASILTSQYDLVCNGFEVGGGSIRSNRPEVLEAVFEVMGYTKSQIHEQFGHMLEAFSFGAPPHGGCAFGIERLIMMIANERYLREVVAFPMTSGGKTAVMDAPSRLTKKQLKELGLGVQ